MKNLLLFLFLITCFFTNAQESKNETPKRVYTTKFLGQEKAPVIDGVLDDVGWSIVPWDGDFIERSPDENTPPEQQTKFKIVYDAKNLYIAARVFDTEPDKIEKRLSRRDGFEGDYIEIHIDSYHDLRTAFSFTTTAAGVKGDEAISENGQNFDESWNPIWYTKTTIDDQGWVAEIKIPLSQLRFSKSEKQIWGFQFMRKLFRENERSLWQRIPQASPGWVSEFGELHGLEGLKPQKQLEIQPFTVAKYDTYLSETSNPFRDGKDFQLNGGVDAKIGVTNDLTLDLTMNPDFGQVEADPAEISLDGFEIFFEEQRPFFVENNNIFTYRVSQSQTGNTFGSDNLFFSRRIGRSPQGNANTKVGEFSDQPVNTTILGAAKFSGKTKKGWSIGILESVTAKEYAEIDTNGDRREELVEPLTNYFLGRLQKDFNNHNTFVGGIFTATNRDLPNHLAFLHKAAFTGGLDFKHLWKNRSWYVGGDIVFSHVTGSAEAITNTQKSLRHSFGRIDANHLEVDPNRTSLTGTGGNIQVGKQSGHWNFESGFTWRSPELELNDLGFQRQADDLRHYTWIGYQTLKPEGIFRSYRINYNHWSSWDFEGNHNLLQWNVNSWANFKNNWFGNVHLNYRPVSHSNFALRDGPRLRVSPSLYYGGRIGTDNRKKVRLWTNYFGGKAFDNSMSSYSMGVGVSYQPTNALRISINPSFDVNKDKLQFVENIEANNKINYINASIEQRTLSMSLRVNYTINPNLTIQYYGQPFISRGLYSDFKTIVNAQAINFKDRFHFYDVNQISFDATDEVYKIDEDVNGIPDYEFDNPDFSLVQFRSNLVVRWEYIPGSEIFLVWSQGNSGNQDPRDDLFQSLDKQILGEKGENTFLIKATYRFML